MQDDRFQFWRLDRLSEHEHDIVLGRINRAPELSPAELAELNVLLARITARPERRARRARRMAGEVEL